MRSLALLLLLLPSLALADCKNIVKMSQEHGAIRIHEVTREQVTVFVAGPWYGMPFDLKEAVAMCVHDTVAGEGKTLIVPVVFLDHLSGRRQASYKRGKLTPD